jgi:hypothetical protein
MRSGLYTQNVNIFLRNKNVKHMLFPYLLVNHRMPHEALSCFDLLDLGGVNILEPLILVPEVYIFEEVFLLYA